MIEADLKTMRKADRSRLCMMTKPSGPKILLFNLELYRTQGNLRADLREANLEGADLRGTDLVMPS